MVQKPVPLTRDGLEKLKAELHELRIVRRHDVADRILQAKEIGGTVNNAEFDDAKNKQAFVEGRILTLENMVNNAVIITHEKSGSDIVELGSTVTVSEPSGDLVQYDIVGSAEANPSQGRISNESPVGMALLGRKTGDKVGIDVPAGHLELTVVEVK